MTPSLKTTIERVADDHGLGRATVSVHTQLFGTSLYRVRIIDRYGDRHGFDYVPNPQQPRSVQEQKIEQLVVGLKEMVTDDDHDTSNPSLAV